MESEFSCYSLLNMKVIWAYSYLLTYHYKFMSGYLYFPNNLKDQKTIYRFIWQVVKIFFQLMVTALKESMNL